MLGETKQRQAVVAKLGGPGSLRVEERGVPEPGPGEVRIKVVAAGVAFADVMMRHGKYPGTPKTPFTPGYDLAGVVDEAGAGVSGVEAGQGVVALTQFGANAQYVCVPAGEVVPVPAGVDLVEAACIPLNYVTAHQMLHRIARVEPGERILVHGAAGGVGTAMLQLGKLAGLEMYGTASEKKHDLVADYGAEPIDYRREDFVARVRELTGDGVDAAFDPIGGEHVARSFASLREGGRLVAYGFSSAVSRGGNIGRIFVEQSLRMALWSVLPNGKRASSYNVAQFKKRHPEWFKNDLARLLELLAAGDIQPVIAERLPLEGVERAHELVESAGAKGKLVLLPNG